MPADIIDKPDGGPGRPAMTPEDPGIYIATLVNDDDGQPRLCILNSVGADDNVISLRLDGLIAASDIPGGSLTASVIDKLDMRLYELGFRRLDEWKTEMGRAVIAMVACRKTHDPEINAPMDAVPDPATTERDRYAVLIGDDDDIDYRVYQCLTEEGAAYTVARTYLRDAQGLHSDGRYPVVAVASTYEEAVSALKEHPGKDVAVAVPVARDLLGPDVKFAPDGMHPTLGVSTVP